MTLLMTLLGGVGLPNNADDPAPDANAGSDDETLVNSERDPTFWGSNSSQITLVPSPAEGASHPGIVAKARVPANSEANEVASYTGRTSSNIGRADAEDDAVSTPAGGSWVSLTSVAFTFLNGAANNRS